MSKRQWNNLAIWHEAGYLDPIDLAIAEHLHRTDFPLDEASASLICHLSKCSRLGHLCIKVTPEEIIPIPENTWIQDEEEEKKAKPDWNLVNSLIKQGAQAFAETCPQSIQRFQDLHYFQKSWQNENDCAAHLNRLLKAEPQIALDMSAVESKIAALLDEGKLLIEQADAIRNACSRSMSIIHGGPGTGKTYTAGLLIRILYTCMPENRRENCKIVLAAPTGKAASNLQMSLGRAVGSDFTLAPAKTLHALLGKNGNTFLNADVIVIDESSMIDAQMMAKLLKAVKTGTRLIMLGDGHQLPPVESGCLFKEFIDYLSGHPKYYPNQLVKCVRAELKGIVDFAAAINQGNADKAIQLMKEGQGVSHVATIDLKQPRKPLYQSLQKEYLHFFQHALSPDSDPEAILKQFNRFRILSPMRKGPCGIESLNHLFVQAMIKLTKQQEWIFAPIMIIKNDYQSELFNGEVGVLAWKLNKEDVHSYQKGDFALFQGKEGIRKIPAVLLPQFEFAFCLSVHKSQGSEFDHVLLMLPERSEKFGRELLYTAATRAKKKLELICEESTFKQCVNQRLERLSGLKHFFK